MERTFTTAVNAAVIFLETLILLFVISINNIGQYMLYFPCIVIILSTAVRQFITKAGSRTKVVNILLLAEIFAVFLLSINEDTNLSKALFFTKAYGIVLNCTWFTGISHSVLSFLLVNISDVLRYIRWNYFDIQYITPIVIENIVIFTFIYGIMFFIKYLVNQKRALSAAMEQLDEKKRQLEEANEQLQKSMDALEELTILRERNRIAHEMHDTVGHTLTTALVEIEAAKMLILKDPETAIVKLGYAHQQAQKGLNGIRNAAKAIKENSQRIDFICSLQELVYETEQHTGASIKCRLEPIPDLTPRQHEVLYNAMQEGLTNGIRHGKSKCFVCVLEWSNGIVSLNLQDNGIGCEVVCPGFGLTAMKESIVELGGKLSISSSVGNGFSLYIELPVVKEKKNGENKDSPC